jgi:hypothetical protein
LSHQVVGLKQPLHIFGGRLASVYPFSRLHSCGSLRHWVCHFFIDFLSPVGDIYLCTLCTNAMLSIVQSSWLSEEEFGGGHIDLKPATARSVLGKWNV